MSEDHRTVIEGEHTEATVMTTQYDENCGEQIQEMVNHPAFQNNVAIMPDTHFGAGAVIGFTMPIGNRVVPNTVGVDIGCGMFALNLGFPEVLESHLYIEDQMGQFDSKIRDSEDQMGQFDSKIRETIPMGRSTHDNPDYHIVDDFPWEKCDETLEIFADAYGIDPDFKGYGKDYFLNTCKRVEYDVNRAIASMGTLGGGNHFIEIAKSQKSGEYWVVIHSGSRGIGLSIAKYWQDKATEYRDVSQIRDDIQPWMWDYVKFSPDVDDEDLRQWVLGGKGESFYDMEAIRRDFDGEQIEERRQELKSLIPNKNRNEELDFLEGEQAVGYFIDMIFAQRYASENRKQMAYAVADILGVEPKDEIESVHNYVDFRDQVIRKGATRAHDDERLIIPFNMRDGTIVCKGKGNPEWNFSAPHGAGRRMSRTQAFNELSFDKFKEEMEGIFSTSVTEDTLDEAPMAYKETAVVESVIHEAAEIVDRWEPVHNIKAEE